MFGFESFWMVWFFDFMRLIFIYLLLGGEMGFV